MEKDKKKLRTGFTTGTAAAASVKGALLYLIKGVKTLEVEIPFLSSGSVVIPVKELYKTGENTVYCSVIKDGGDDPDVTNKAEIGANVSFIPSDIFSVNIDGGTGVGRVTKKGLEVPVGQAAINSGPRKMIENAVFSVMKEKKGVVNIEICVPDGILLAEKTLNKRLGIIGGISILGTTGIERPMSHDAYIATIKSSIKVAVAAGIKEVVFTTGRRSERFSMEYMPEKNEEAFIQTGDFFKASLEAAVNSGIENIIIAVFFGKALKMAQKIPHTHAANAELCLNKLSEWAIAVEKDEDVYRKIANCNTAREAFELLDGKFPEIINCVGDKMIEAAVQFSSGKLKIKGIIYDFNGRPAYVR